MAERCWTPRYRVLQADADEPLSPNREARIRQLDEELAREGSLAAEGTRAALRDLLAEVSRLRRLIDSVGGDPDSRPPVTR